MDSDEPATEGVGSPVTAVAEEKFPLVMSEVEYLKSYVVAVPELLSSPGAVQETKNDEVVGLDKAKLLMAAGAVISGGVRSAMVFPSRSSADAKSQVA